MQDIRLVLTVSEVNEILDALGVKAYASVYRLIAKIQEQAAGQLDSEGSEAHRAEASESPEGAEKD